MSKSVCYSGKIISLQPIQGADFIELATVVCGEGGKWCGVVKKGEFESGSLCIAFLQDAVVPKSDALQFMEAHNWIVKMRRFKKVPSECVIIPTKMVIPVGVCLMNELGVTKYVKQLPVGQQGLIKGNFPSFIQKTDEDNFQRCENTLTKMVGMPCVTTLKYDGTSTTVYRYNGTFGVCSRNLELKDSDCIYWYLAKKYNLEERLSDGFAIQFEACGPKVQNNCHKLSEPEAFVFLIYDIHNKEYLSWEDTKKMTADLGMKTVEYFNENEIFDDLDSESLRKKSSSIAKLNGKPLEGIVIRATASYGGYEKLSFKVINLDYEG